MALQPTCLLHLSFSPSGVGTRQHTQLSTSWGVPSHTCCSVVFLRSIFSKSILVKGERDKRYNSGGSELPSPVRGNKVVVKATHRFNLIFPHIWWQRWDLQLLGIHRTTSIFDQRRTLELLCSVLFGVLKLLCLSRCVLIFFVILFLL